MLLNSYWLIDNNNNNNEYIKNYSNMTPKKRKKKKEIYIYIYINHVRQLELNKATNLVGVLAQLLSWQNKLQDRTHWIFLLLPYDGMSHVSLWIPLRRETLNFTTFSENYQFLRVHCTYQILLLRNIPSLVAS